MDDVQANTIFKNKKARYESSWSLNTNLNISFYNDLDEAGRARITYS